MDINFKGVDIINVLIIYTHPNEKSLNAAILGEVVKGCHKNSAVSEVRVLDLYKENFNPVLEFNEHKKRRDMQFNSEFEKHRNLLTWAEKIVFIYPIWWGRPPAMLLGFFDQVLALGFAYKYTKSPIAEGLLKNKSVICISTMQGPTIYSNVWLKNAHKVLMRRAVLNFVGIKKVKFFQLANMEKKNGNQVKYLNRLNQYFTQMKK